MKLNAAEVGILYYFLAEYRRAGLPIRPPFTSVYERFDRAVRFGEVSPTRHQSCSGSAELEHVELVGAKLAADILGWHGPAGLRRLQRHADKLGAEKIGGRLVFRADTIKHHRDLGDS